MSLVDFMQQLQDQDNIIYSEVPEPSIRVIPPEKTCTKIIPPESTAIKPPTTIKLKIKQKQVDVPNVVEKQTQTNNIQQPIVNQQPQQQFILNQQQTTIQNTTTVEQHAPPQNIQQNITTDHQISDDELFVNSGTELSKKSLWLDYYLKAKRSRKSNPIVDRMKVGRFTITPDNKVLLLPDYDIVGKDPDAVLKDKWF